MISEGDFMHICSVLLFVIAIVFILKFNYLILFYLVFYVLILKIYPNPFGVRTLQYHAK